MSGPEGGKAFCQGAHREICRDPPDADGDPQYQVPKSCAYLGIENRGIENRLSTPFVPLFFSPGHVVSFLLFLPSPLMLSLLCWRRRQRRPAARVAGQIIRMTG